MLTPFVLTVFGHDAIFYRRYDATTVHIVGLTLIKAERGIQMSGSTKMTKRVFFAFLLLVVLYALPIQAAVPKKVKLKKATSTATTVTLNWKKVDGIKGYRIYTYDEDGNPYIIAKPKKTKTSHTLKKLTCGLTYTFYMTAYNAEGESNPSKKVTVTPSIKGLEQIQHVVVTNSATSVSLRYYRNSYADGYVIYRKNEAGEYKIIAKTGKLSYQVKGLKSGETYYFRVGTWLKVGGKVLYGAPSKELVCKTVKKTGKISKVHAFYYKAVMKESHTTDGVTIKAGAKVTVLAKGKSTVRISYNNKKCWVPSSKVSINGYITDYKAKFSKDLAEAYVNAKGYSSSQKYLVWINTYTQHIYVFEGKQYNWELIHTFICSTGMFGVDETGKHTETPMGKCYIYRKQYEFWFAGDQVAYYCSAINGGFIHSWLYKPDGSYYPGVGKLGVPASHGCVRLAKADCKWIYDNCPVSTTVIIY